MIMDDFILLNLLFYKHFMCTRSIANWNFRLELMAMSSHALIVFDNTYSLEISVRGDYFSNI